MQCVQISTNTSHAAVINDRRLLASANESDPQDHLPLTQHDTLLQQRVFALGRRRGGEAL
jgi:hypothetical protein